MHALLRTNFIQAGLLATADTSSFICSGVSAGFAVKLFKSWLSEKDISSVTAGLRKVGMDNRLMVRHRVKYEALYEAKIEYNLIFCLHKETIIIYAHLISS